MINATDMVRGSRFSFRQYELDYLCADLGPIPVEEMLEHGGLRHARQILMIVANAETEKEFQTKEGGFITTGLATLLGTVSGIQIRSSARVAALPPRDADEARAAR